MPDDHYVPDGEGLAWADEMSQDSKIHPTHEPISVEETWETELFPGENEEDIC